jgi:hypothetical protein
MDDNNSSKEEFNFDSWYKSLEEIENKSSPPLGPLGGEKYTWISNTTKIIIAISSVLLIAGVTYYYWDN